MDVVTIVVSALSPFLPHLLKVGKPVAEEAGKKIGEKIGEGTWEKVKQAWSRIFPKLQEKPLAKGAAEALVEDPEDEDAKEALVTQLQKLLQADPPLAQEIQKLLGADQAMMDKARNITQTVTGDKNIVIGEASGSVSITNS